MMVWHGVSWAQSDGKGKRGSGHGKREGKERELRQALHGFGLVEVMGEGLRAPEADAGHEVPDAAEDVWEQIPVEEISRMAEAQQLDKHVEMQGLTHLRLHDSQIGAHMPEDSGSLPCRDAVWRAARDVGAIERAQDQPHRPMEAAGGG